MGMKIVGRERRKLRIRKRVNGTAERPRMSSRHRFRVTAPSVRPTPDATFACSR